jgi:hypothetical protein
VRELSSGLNFWARLAREGDCCSADERVSGFSHELAKVFFYIKKTCLPGGGSPDRSPPWPTARPYYPHVGHHTVKEKRKNHIIFPAPRIVFLAPSTTVGLHRRPQSAATPPPPSLPTSRPRPPSPPFLTPPTACPRRRPIPPSSGGATAAGSAA